MAIFKCKMCGGTLEITGGETVATCEYCGTKQTLPKTDDDVISTLFNRANNLRLKCEFDKAAQIYEKIVEQDSAQAEAYWGIVLCKYGIEYVEDPKTMGRIPTCHRTLFEAVTADADYLAAVEHADAAQRGIYEAEARAIDILQKDILAIVKNEKPFDVFLCYKETDEYGKRTVDSAIANDIYHQLTQEGFKVFYAAITLEDKLGTAYEPYIFAALNSAKVMLVLGTKPEYFTAVWVKNEWSRFLHLMKTDRSKLLIPCYRDMDAYDLPEEFAHLQAQDMSKIGFINDVVRGIKKVAQTAAPAPAVVKETVVTGGNTNVAPLLKRAFMFLEDGEWDRADEFCEQVLNIDPECAEAYLGKLMAELHVTKQENLKDCAVPFDRQNNYQKVLRFASEERKVVLNGYIEYINTRNENERLESIYTRAKTMMAGNTVKAFNEAADVFDSISEYKDAVSMAIVCREEAETLRKDLIYAAAKSKMSNGNMTYYTEAIRLFESISGWKDADEQTGVCRQRFEQLKAQKQAERIENNRRAEEARVERERLAELQRQAVARRRKRNKKIGVIAIAIFCVIVAFVVVLTTVIIPNGKYNDAIALMDAGNYSEAISAFKELDGYKGSDQKINECSVAIFDGKYNDAITLMDAGNYSEAISAFEGLDGYKDSDQKITECNVAIFDGKYNDAIELMESEKLDEATAIFHELGDYRDSAEKLVEIRLMRTDAELENVKVGGCIHFGVYEQDNNTANGKEDIEWQVLDIQAGRVLVISKYALDCKPYNTEYDDVTWATCTLRAWLNGEFVNAAFSDDEQRLIPIVNVPADKNPDYDIDPGDITQSKVFLLSIVEANKCFGSDSERQCEPTPYAVSAGVYRSDSGNCWWSLRSPGYYHNLTSFVEFDGNVDERGTYVTYSESGVRPAMWITLPQ